MRTRTDWMIAAAASSSVGMLTGLTSLHRARLVKEPVTFDAFAIAAVAGAVLFAGVLLGGHYFARNVKGGRTGWYAVAGAMAALIAFAASGGAALIKLAAEQGLISLAIGLPLLIGAAIGVSYAAAAGFENHDAERPDSIRNALEQSKGPDPALIEAGNAQYYAGPVQVRFSLGLMFASGALLGLILSGLAMVLTLGGNLASGDFGTEFPVRRTIGMVIASTAGMGALMLLPTLLGHYAAHFMKARTAGAYVGYGVLANVLLGLVTGIFLLAAPFAAATLALYRRLAGIEPLGLPDDVLVRDPSTLVGADHPVRRYHRVVPTTRRANGGSTGTPQA